MRLEMNAPRRRISRLAETPYRVRLGQKRSIEQLSGRGLNRTAATVHVEEERPLVP